MFTINNYKSDVRVKLYYKVKNSKFVKTATFNQIRFDPQVGGRMEA